MTCINEGAQASADTCEHCSHMTCVRKHNICCWCDEEMEPNYDAEYDAMKERQLREEVDRNVATD